MDQRHILEKLVDLSPGMEIWWDSSPVIFDPWCAKTLDQADPARRDVLKAQFARMVNPDDPLRQLFRGVTTNPALSYQAIGWDPDGWREVTFGIMRDNPGIAKEDLFWKLYKEVVRRGAAMYRPLFDRSHYREGYLSGQVDPRSVFDKEAMIRQAEELAAIAPNVMIKVPGSAEGYEVIEYLTAKGIPTNNTLTFHLPQLMDCAKSVMRGLETARANGVDLTQWRSVITHMESRYGDLGGLRDEARKVGLELSDGDVRLAELAIFKKACRLIDERKYQSKMLSCSLRMGPTVDGVEKIWHLEEKTGASIVMTCPPPFIEALSNFAAAHKLEFVPDRIHADIPADVMDKLMRIPFFERAFAEDGYTRTEYNAHPSLVKTAEQFSKATWEMVEFTGKCLEDGCFTS